MKAITARIDRSKYATTVDNGEISLIADEYISYGGTGKGFSPPELLAASLGSCTCITLRMYSDRKQWDLEEVITDVNVKTDEKHNILNISTKIKLSGNLNDEQKERLLQIAHLCPIHKALINNVNIQTELI